MLGKFNFQDDFEEMCVDANKKWMWRGICEKLRGSVHFVINSSYLHNLIQIKH